LFNVHPNYNPKGLGLFARGYIELYRATGEREYLDRAKMLLNTLMEKRSTGYHGISWGYPFDWQSRIFIPRGTPSAVVTTTVGTAFVEMYQITKEERYLDAARKVRTFLITDLKRTKTADNRLCFSYTPIDNFTVHNANLMVCAFLTRTENLVKGASAERRIVRDAVNYTVGCQRSDGSWYYWGPPSRDLGVIDSFHTGFVLRSLAEIYLCKKNLVDLDIIEKGYRYYLKNLLTESGRPRYTSTKEYPVDIHACAEGILCPLHVGELMMKEESLNTARRVLGWTLENMYNRNGYFHYKQLASGAKIRYPFMRWGQAWMMLALAKSYIEHEGAWKY